MDVNSNCFVLVIVWQLGCKNGCKGLQTNIWLDRGIFWDVDGLSRTCCHVFSDLAFSTTDIYKTLSTSVEASPKARRLTNDCTRDYQEVA